MSSSTSSSASTVSSVDEATSKDGKGVALSYSVSKASQKSEDEFGDVVHGPSTDEAEKRKEQSNKGDLPLSMSLSVNSKSASGKSTSSKSVASVKSTVSSKDAASFALSKSGSMKSSASGKEDKSMTSKGSVSIALSKSASTKSSESDKEDQSVTSQDSVPLDLSKSVSMKSTASDKEDQSATSKDSVSLTLSKSVSMTSKDSVSLALSKSVSVKSTALDEEEQEPVSVKLSRSASNKSASSKKEEQSVGSKSSILLKLSRSASNKSAASGSKGEASSPSVAKQSEVIEQQESEGAEPAADELAPQNSEDAEAKEHAPKSSKGFLPPLFPKHFSTSSTKKSTTPGAAIFFRRTRSIPSKTETTEGGVEAAKNTSPEDGRMPAGHTLTIASAPSCSEDSVEIIASDSHVSAEARDTTPPEDAKPTKADGASKVVDDIKANMSSASEIQDPWPNPWTDAEKQGKPNDDFKGRLSFFEKFAQQRTAPKQKFTSSKEINAEVAEEVRSDQSPQVADSVIESVVGMVLSSNSTECDKSTGSVGKSTGSVVKSTGSMRSTGSVVKSTASMKSTGSAVKSAGSMKSTGETSVRSGLVQESSNTFVISLPSMLVARAEATAEAPVPQAEEDASAECTKDEPEADLETGTGAESESNAEEDASAKSTKDKPEADLETSTSVESESNADESIENPVELLEDWKELLTSEDTATANTDKEASGKKGKHRRQSSLWKRTKDMVKVRYSDSKEAGAADSDKTEQSKKVPKGQRFKLGYLCLLSPCSKKLSTIEEADDELSGDASKSPAKSKTEQVFLSAPKKEVGQGADEEAADIEEEQSVEEAQSESHDDLIEILGTNESSVLSRPTDILAEAEDVRAVASDSQSQTQAEPQEEAQAEPQEEAQAEPKAEIQAQTQTTPQAVPQTLAAPQELGIDIEEAKSDLVQLEYTGSKQHKSWLTDDLGSESYTGTHTGPEKTFSDMSTSGEVTDMSTIGEVTDDGVGVGQNLLTNFHLYLGAASKSIQHNLYDVPMQEFEKLRDGACAPGEKPALDNKGAMGAESMDDSIQIKKAGTGVISATAMSNPFTVVFSELVDVLECGVPKKQHPTMKATPNFEEEKIEMFGSS